MSAAFIGLDLAKSVFQVHGDDGQGKVVVAKRLRRDAVLAFFANLEPCVVGMEACAGSHFWAKDCPARSHGASDVAAVRQALRQAPEVRPGRRRGDL
jgi:transposase